MSRVLLVNGSPHPDGCTAAAFPATNAVKRESASFPTLSMKSRRNLKRRTYWNQVHGFTAEDVKKDLEGRKVKKCSFPVDNYFPV